MVIAAKQVAAITNITNLSAYGRELSTANGVSDWWGPHLQQECAMLRKMLIGLATITAIGIASVPMDASARGGGGGHGGGGGGGFHGGGGGGFHSGGGGGFHAGGSAFHGGGFAARSPSSGGLGATRFAAMPSRTGFARMSGRGFHHHHHFRHFVSFGIGVPYAYADYPYGDCYDVVRVRTYHGWRWRRVYVCG
jgi:hypothetical protein